LSWHETGKTSAERRLKRSSTHLEQAGFFTNFNCYK
jgi:hypothetical protein